MRSQKKNIGVGLSGGVDSAWAAWLLLEQGWMVEGFFMELPLPDLARQRQQAQQVARALSIPLHCVDLAQAFQQQVLDYFVDTYRRGQTPNPCLVCNQRIKFGALADHMRARGMDYISSGHYARIIPGASGARLLRGLDKKKDQSYFLARLSQRQLSQLRLPLADWTKEAVYRAAKSIALPVSSEESQDVCFMPGKLEDFLLTQGLRQQPGDMVNRQGRILGAHAGLCHYTIGQRRGLGVADAHPWYVVEIDPIGQRLVLGKKEELAQNLCAVSSIQWIGAAPSSPWQGKVQLRSRHQAAPALLSFDPAGLGCIEFAQPQGTISPGQFAVFYQDEEVLGSAVIRPNQPASQELQP